MKLTTGDRICLLCGHLHIKTDDKSKKICECEQPFLIPATEIHQMGIGELRRKYKVKAW